MARPKSAVPSYRLHKATGQAVVTINENGRRRDVYLGVFQSPASRVEYARIVTELSHDEPTPLRVARVGGGLTVNELIRLYLQHAENHYHREDGTLTSEVVCLKTAFRPLRQTCGHTLADEFGPVALKRVRQAMIESGWTRRVINKSVDRIRRLYKWAVGEELVPESSWRSLKAVDGLKRGRSAAKEKPTIGPVSRSVVEETLRFTPPTVAAMARFQLATGCRPGEVCGISFDQVDMTGEVWEYRPVLHKTKHKDRERIIFLGPVAQTILRERSTVRRTDAIFSPRTAHDERCGCRGRRTTTKVGGKLIGSQYTVSSYRRAIHFAVRAANRWVKSHSSDCGPNLPTVTFWHPNQLRHSFATETRRVHGLEAAQVLLGHAKADVTQVYAERDAELARRVALADG